MVTYMLFNPCALSSPPQLCDQRAHYLLTCMNCFNEFSVGDSCYQCNVCVVIVFCTECHQDQEDTMVRVRRHRRAHTMTHFVIGSYPVDGHVGRVVDSGASLHFTSDRPLFTGATG